MAAAAVVPQLPAGFTLDQPEIPPLPAGFSLDQPQQSAIGAGGGPQAGRKYVTNRERGQQSMQLWQRQPLHVRMTMAPDELMPGGIEARNQAMADAGAVMLSAPEQALAGVTGAAGTLADVATGDLNNRSQSWAFQPRTSFGQRGAQVTGEMVQPAVEATSRGYDRAFGTGPLAQTIKERGAQALEAVGTMLGGAGAASVGARQAVRAGKQLTAPRATAEAVIARQPQGVSQGAAAASPSITNISDGLRNAIVQAGSRGNVNTQAVRRHVDADTLPVPIRLTEGQATGDVVRLSREQNMRGRADDLARFFSEQNTALAENLHTIRDNVGPRVFSSNVVEHGDTLLNAYQAHDDILKADINTKYKALSDANGGSLPIDGKAFIKRASADLKRENKGVFVPPEIKRLLVFLQKRQGPMRFGEFENLRTILATASRSSTDGNARSAINIVRNALEEMPLSGEAANLKPLADAARNAAKSRFSAIEADPAYKAIVDGMEPDKFVQKFIINGNRDHIKRMLETVPEAKETIGVAVLDYLRDQARIGPNGGNFATASYMRALKKLDSSLKDILGPDAVEQLEALGRVAGYVTHQPRGSFVNNSNTFVAAGREGAANVLEGIANVGGTQMGSIARRGLQDRAIRAEVQRLIAPGAGISQGK